MSVNVTMTTGLTVRISPKKNLKKTRSMDYEEILKCYEGETDIHASTSFEFGLMNDLYYQLFYSYPEVD